jgi:hypothetical protein
MKTKIPIDAGCIAPSCKRYEVILPHDHLTLSVGDIVIMTETPDLDNLLLREKDMTLHRLMDNGGQYIHIALAEQPNV